MRYLLLIVTVLIHCGSITAKEEIPHFYQKNVSTPITELEKDLVNHANISYMQALEYSSKLNDNEEFASDRSCNSQHGIIPYYHLLNNLCEKAGASHLHIGLYTGGSFVAALYGNQELLRSKIGVDWFQADWGFREICFDVFEKYLFPGNYQILEADCFKIKNEFFQNNIDIYLYDADHSTESHKKAFTYYNEAFANVFIAVVDDWKWDYVREGTFQAFDELGYTILYQDQIPNSPYYGNGQYLAVIRK